MVSYLMITHWHWWGLAALLIVAELLSPCLYFMAIAIAAALAGLIVRMAPGMPGLWQVGLFIVLSAFTLSLAYYYRNKGARRGGGKRPKADSPESKH